MKARVLPPEEWDRLAQSELPALLALTHPRDVDVVGIESGGELAACIAVLKITHFEGVWVDPRFRGNPGVMRSLLREAYAIPEARGEHWAIGGAATPDMRGYLSRIGAPLQADYYAIKVGGDECPQQ